MDTPAEWYNWEVPENSFVRMYVTNRLIYEEVIKGLESRGAEWHSGHDLRTYEPEEITTMLREDVSFILYIDDDHRVYYTRASASDRMRSIFIG